MQQMPKNIPAPAASRDLTVCDGVMLCPLHTLKQVESGYRLLHVCHMEFDYYAVLNVVHVRMHALECQLATAAHTTAAGTIA